MDDERTLGELGITDKAVLVHLSSTHEPYHGVDYDKLAKSVAARRHHQDENLRMMQQENLWAPDERTFTFGIKVCLYVFITRRNCSESWI